MIFNDEQFASLQLYEQQMQTALRSNYGHIDSAKAKRVHEILKAAGITSPKMNYTCGWCVMRLLKLAGRHYFADKAERAKLAAANDADAVQATLEDAGTKTASKAANLSAQQALDESAAKPSLDVKADENTRKAAKK